MPARVRSSLALVAAIAATSLVFPAGAASVHAFTLTDPAQTAAWSGEHVLSQMGAFSGEVAACTTDTCDRIDLTVALGDDAWGEPGGMLVQIQWAQVDGGWDLDLFAFAPDGTLAARSDAWAFSRNEGLWIADPADGTYTVWVVPKNVIAQPVITGVLEPLRYEGFVRFGRGLTVTREELNDGQPWTKTFVAAGVTSPQPVRELLPDLRPTKPSNFHIESTAGAQFYFYMDRGLRHQPSCYPWETVPVQRDEPEASMGPTRCLRWDQGEHNLGEGPLELHIYDLPGETETVYQRIYATDGSVRQLPVGTAFFSQTHGHFHYRGWQEIDLYRLEAGGSWTWVRSGEDKGICMVDIENNRFGRTDLPPAPLGYSAPWSCLSTSHQDPNDPTFPGASYFEMGVSPGFADIYPWFIADQYIDISDASDGVYAVHVRQDARDQVVEIDEHNNVNWGCVLIEGDDATEVDCPSDDFPGSPLD